MDPIVIVLATAAGALIGTSVGILLFRRKLRPPISDGELAELKGKVQTSESSLAAASANLEDLRKQIALQEAALLQNGDALKKKQEQVEIESAEVQKEKTRRSAAELSVQELSAKTVLLTEECAKLEAQFKEAQTLAGDNAARIASTESELEAGKRRIQELTEQTAQLTSESVELKRVGEQDARLRALLEVQLNAEQDRTRQMALRIEELQRERSQLELKLQNESSSAAKGLELLLMAQEKLSSVFKSLGTDGQNGHHVPAPVAADATGPAAVHETTASR